MTGVRVSVRSNLDRVMAEFRADTKAIVTKAVPRALNRALDQAATATSREIRGVYNVKHGAILRAVKKIRARSGSPFAELQMQRARIPLIEFGARWRQGQKIGATVQVFRGGARKAVPGAFIAAVDGGRRQLFVRVGQARYPIKSLRSLSLPQAFANQVVTEAVARIARESFDKNLEQQIRFLTG